MDEMTQSLLTAGNALCPEAVPGPDAPAVTADTPLEIALRELDKSGVQSLAVESDGAVIGRVSHASAARALAENEARLAARCAALHDEARHAATRMSCLQAIGLDMASANTLELVATGIGAATESVWDWNTFMLLARQSGAFLFRTVLHVQANGRERQCQMPCQYSLNEYVEMDGLLRGEAILVDRADDADDRFLPRLAPPHKPSQSLMYAPVRINGATAAILTVQSTRFGRFRVPDIEFLKQICAVVAPAVARCDADKRGQAFASLGLRLGAAQTPEACAEIIVDVADQLIGWDSCSVYLCTAGDQAAPAILHLDEIDGRRTPVPVNPAVPISPVALRTFEAGPQLILRDDPAFADDFAPFGDRLRPSASLMFVPLRIATQEIGILSIQSYTPRAYDRKDLSVLQDLADHCSGALRRATARK